MAEDKPIVPGIDGSQNQSAEKSGMELPRIRTYAADMSKVIKARGETLASIVNKEQTVVQKKRPEQHKPTSPRRIAILIGTGVLVLAGIGVLVGVFVFSPRDAVDVQTSGVIFANEVQRVNVTAQELFIEQLATIRRDKNLSLGEILRVDLVENGAVVNGPALAQQLRVPPELAREVSDVMVGIHAFDRNQPFIIMRVATYDRSFGAMLVWEQNMARALADFFAPTNAIGGAPVLVFIDEIVRNLDIRKSQDEWPILYTFPERGLLIITTNEFTLREIMTRLSASQASL